jgi:hypothetical protein
MSVHFDRARERWVVRWREAGRQRARRFADEGDARTFDARVVPARAAAAAERLVKPRRDVRRPSDWRTTKRQRVPAVVSYA